jgi:hypothetical protein
MAEIPADGSSSTGQPEGHHHHGSHGRHHRHSYMQRRAPGRHSHRGRKKFRIEEQSKRSHLRRTERILAKHFLKIVGFVLILGAVYFLINSVTPLSVVWDQMTVKSVSIFHSTQYTLTHEGVSTGTYITIVISTLFILLTQFISIRIKSVETELVAFSAWAIYGTWLILFLFFSGSAVIFYVLLISSAFFYLVFFFSNIFFSSYQSAPKMKQTLEILIITGNSVFYYALMIFILHNFGFREYKLWYTILLLLLNLVVLYIVYNKKVVFSKITYQVFAGALISMILPLIFRMDSLILFFALFSMFLMIFSKYTGHQFSILLSLVSMAAFFFTYLYHWVYEFFPSMFGKSGQLEDHLFIKGLIAGIAVIIPIVVNTRIIKKIHIEFSKKWFDLSKYRIILKGMMLVSVFLALFWVVNYFVAVYIHKQYVKQLVWFSYYCLYFIFSIIILARQRSSFLPLMFIVAVLTLFIYPLVVHRHILNIRELYLESDPSYFWAFLYHYVDVLLMLFLLVTMLRYVNRAFKGVKEIIKTFWIYFSLVMMFILFSEFDHTMVILNYFKGIKIDDTIEISHQMPYSFLMILFSILILAIGFIRKSRFLRIYSLVVLSFVIAKILIFDLPSLDTWAIVLVFLSLGILLLVISFYYSRVKHFFVSHGSTGHSSKGSRRERRSFKEPEV